LPITQPHKLIHDAPIEARLQMMNLAVQDTTAISIGLCTHGLFIDICRAVALAYPPQTRLWFISGRDAAERILTWPYADPVAALSTLFAQAELLVADREGVFTLPDIAPVREQAAHIHHLPLAGEISHISATEIRTRLAKGEEVDELMPWPVLHYIQEHRLYQPHPEEPTAIR